MTLPSPSDAAAAASSTSSDVVVHYRASGPGLTDNNVGYMIKQVYQSLNRVLDQDMAPLGLTAMQWRPVACLAKGHASTSVELARILAVDSGAMTRTLDRLEAKGLLVRTRSKEDRRVVDIELTAEGQRTAKEIPARIARALNHYLRGFSSDEVDMLSHFLQRMLANGSIAPSNVPPGKAPDT